MSDYRVCDIQPSIQLACEVNGCTELAAKIKYRFSKRMTRTGGTANYQNQEITISQYYWDADEEATNSREQLIFHETCHLIVFYLNGNKRPIGAPHGSLWKAAMRRCGVDPKRTHSVEMNAPKRHTRKYCVPCGCPDGHQMSPQAYARYRRGTKYRCMKCNAIMSVRSQGLENVGTY